MANSVKGGAIADVDVTPEMIKAGAREILAFDRRVMDEDDLAELVYLAMEKFRKKNYE